MTDTNTVTVDLDLVSRDSHNDLEVPLDVLLAEDFEGVTEWVRLLTSEIVDANAQLSERKSDLRAFQHECFQQGDEGKERFFAERAEYDEWRRRAAWRKSRLEKRLSVAKAMRSKMHRDGLHVSASDQTTAERLVDAIREHRNTVGLTEGDEADLRLWQVLYEIGWETK